ncbi:hypothetical protein AOL_s00081g339 [Orbilia oligospora ATCC 24927]|uniref:Plectin/eS10 N-terminal domain-containing protein n=2 Tax=Orbilia oligospora TaxID=2813651 RepID=G1XG46_ARTOA|nr:hypothetical protein AOL_s00081g339 [Orbilia oligospora ATCC 24927]EGX48012.1 hypothetical protein AOL_s00081g339 [Orbilia oligospora ATCC 24927]
MILDGGGPGPGRGGDDLMLNLAKRRLRLLLVVLRAQTPSAKSKIGSVLAAELCVQTRIVESKQQQLQHRHHQILPIVETTPELSDLPELIVDTVPYPAIQDLVKGGSADDDGQCRLIPKADRKKIHEYLFREGVMVAKKDYNLPKHTELDVKNLFVIKACQSLTSRGYLKTQFSWQYYYYTLTPAGLDYLREWLHLPSEIVPATHVKQQRSTAPPRGMMGGDDRRERRGGDRGDRDGYRRRDKEGGAPGEFKPEFRGGFGRGRGGAPPAATQ